MAPRNIKITSVGLGTCTGIEEARQLLFRLFQSFPDLLINPITLLCSDDKNGLIISEVNFDGRQMGYLNGNPPSGKKFSSTGVIIIELNDKDKVKLVRVHCNFRSIYNQLAILKV